MVIKQFISYNVVKKSLQKGITYNACQKSLNTHSIFVTCISCYPWLNSLSDRDGRKESHLNQPTPSLDIIHRNTKFEITYNFENRIAIVQLEHCFVGMEAT